MTTERRFSPIGEFEVRAAGDSKRTFTGYASVFNQWADIGGFREQVAPGAFKRHINRGADVRFLFNHDGKPMARTAEANTLRLAEDTHGLHVEADLDTRRTDVNDLVIAMENREVTQMSFGFQVSKDDWNKDGEMPERTLREVKLFDVSPVTYPAYEGTSAEVRSVLAAAGVPIPEVRALWSALRNLSDVPLEEWSGMDADEIRSAFETLEQFRRPAEGDAPETATPLDALDIELAKRRLESNAHRLRALGVAV